MTAPHETTQIQPSNIRRFWLSSLERSPKAFRYFDKGIMAMVGRNAAVAEVGQGRRELKGPVAFTAWLGVHAMLLDTTRAKIEAIIVWAREYLHLEYSSPILNQPSQAALNLTENES